MLVILPMIPFSAAAHAHRMTQGIPGRGAVYFQRGWESMCKQACGACSHITYRPARLRRLDGADVHFEALGRAGQHRFPYEYSPLSGRVNSIPAAL